MTEPHRYTASEMLTVLSARAAEGRPGRVRRRRCSAARRDARAAHALPGSDDPVRRRRDRRLRRARASCRRRPTTSAAPSAPIWCSAAPKCCCSCSAAMSMSASWAARRSTNTATSIRPSSAIPTHPKTRLPGTGGGNDISSLAQMIVAMKHEKRRFVETCRFHHEPRVHRAAATAARTAACRPAACTASSPSSRCSRSRTRSGA